MTDIVKQLRAPCSPNDEFVIGQWPGEEPIRYDVLRSRASDEIERLRAWNAEIALNAREFAEALREIAKYEIEEGCSCNACQHSAIARAALEGK